MPVAVVAVAVLAAVLRLWGIGWGLPDSIHRFTYHPDEIFQVGAMARMNPFALALDPQFYNYPSGYMNLGSAVLNLVQAYGLHVDDRAAYLIARLVVALLGVLTVPITYAAASRLYGKAAGVMAALIIAITPLHVVHSHFATVDVPAAFWAAAALLGAGLILTRSTFAIYAVAGALAGFAAGTKYNAALALLPVIVAHFVREDGSGWQCRVKDGRIWAALGACIVGFVAATPGFVLWPAKFAGGFLFELQHAASGHGLVFEGRGPGWFDVLVNALGYGLGVLLLAVALGAIALAIVRRKRSDWIILSFLIPYYILISVSEVRFARYAIPILPPLAILVGRMIVDVYTTLKSQGSAYLRLGWVVVCAGVVGYTAVYSLALDRLFQPPDPRSVAIGWINRNVSLGDTIGLPTVPWFYSPPFTPDIAGAVGSRARYDLMSEARRRLVTNPELEWDPAILTGERPDYVVMSDFEYEDVKRTGLPRAKTFFRTLGKQYKEAAVFGKQISFGIDFGPSEQLPHDLKYMSPTIRVYRRK